MRWITINQIRFFNANKEYLILEKDVIFNEIHYKNQTEEVKNSLKRLKYTNPKKRYVVISYKNKQRVLEIGKNIIPYGIETGSIPRRNNGKT